MVSSQARQIARTARGGRAARPCCWRRARAPTAQHAAAAAARPPAPCPCWRWPLPPRPRPPPRSAQAATRESQPGGSSLNRLAVPQGRLACMAGWGSLLVARPAEGSHLFLLRGMSWTPCLDARLHTERMRCVRTGRCSRTANHSLPTFTESHAAPVRTSQQEGGMPGAA